MRMATDISKEYVSTYVLVPSGQRVRLTSLLSSRDRI